MTRLPLLNNRRALLAVLACVLFYGAQALAQLHSIDHVFHAASDACSIYHSIEHHKLGVIQPCVISVLRPGFEAVHAHAYSTPATRHGKSWKSRAPPVSQPA